MQNAVTWLFVPGSRPERFAKAAGAGADVVIVDLEDAVPADAKAAARKNLRSAWPIGSSVAVRINGRSSPEFDDDVALCRKLGPAAVVLPKTESAQDVAVTAEATGSPVLGLVETARGFINLGEICTAPGLVRLVFGSIDLALDLGVTVDAALDTSRSDLVRWSAACGLPAPLDGVTPSINDTEAVERDSRRAKDWGFGGKLCIHPAQLPVVRDAMRPSPEELAWARRVVEADEQALGAAVSLDGAMIDRPVVERARRLLRAAE
ncbi:CoA ester lyase [Saccharopolyspora sp. ASAGF58]|uniref:HpcH/HpaI aldolase/citrate lyase family protein n=1 Tax=Saccharopolyspora sp. ASAGF58 TaxID=2719023 RepID=UPI00143FCD16|nr:CoA ester lyase [Saccharopolyspora sp. ASAGF58]QIZ36271.1 CoA ester lyase [Saccharopolyspora sp. ASAGF58]